MKFLRDYNQHRKFVLIKEQNEGDVEEWFVDSIYVNKRNKFYLTKQNAPNYWDRVKIFSKYVGKTFTDARSIQSELWKYVKDTQCVTKSDGETKTLEEVINSMTSRPITPERFIDGRYGLLTDTILSSVICILEDRNKVKIPEEQKKKTEKAADPIRKEIEQCDPSIKVVSELPASGQDGEQVYLEKPNSIGWLYQWKDGNWRFLKQVTGVKKSAEESGESKEKEEKKQERKTIDINTVYNSEQFKKLVKVKDKHKDEFIVGNKIVEKFDENVSVLENSIKKYNEGEIDGDELKTILNNKISEAENESDYGNASAKEFKDAALELLYHLKDKVLPEII